MDRASELRRHADDLDEKVTCPVCLCVYCKPKLVVPCCHTLCSDCYTALYSQGSGQFACPLCRDKCDVAPLAARRNTAMEDLVDEAVRARCELLRLETEKSARSQWPGRLASQIQCQSEPWDLVLVHHRDSHLFCDPARKRIVRADPSETSLPPLPHDLLFCVGDDLEDVHVFALDGRLLVSEWRLTRPDDQFFDIHRASFDRSTSNLVLSDFVRHQVVIADLAGAVVHVISEVSCPTASCVQVGARRLFLISSNGTRISSFWTADYRPTGASCQGFQLLVDAQCDELQVYATDSEARQICVFCADGLSLLSRLTLDGQPQFVQLLPPGLLLVVVRTSDQQPANHLVLVSTAAGQSTLAVQKDLPCDVKISGLAYDPARDLLFLCDCQNWAINGFLAAPLTFLSL